MKVPKLLALPIVGILFLSACSGPVEPVASVEPTSDSTVEVIELESAVAFPTFRDQLVPSLVLESMEVSTNSTIDGKISFKAPGGVSPSGAWAVIQVPAMIAISQPVASNWECKDSEVAESRQFVCTVEDSKTIAALEAGLPFEIGSSGTPGVFGVTVQAGFGLPTESPHTWEEVGGKQDSVRTSFKVLTPLSTPYKFSIASLERDILDIPAKTFPSVTLPDLGTYTSNSWKVGLNTTSLDSFCALYTGLALSGPVTAGPMVFSDLGGSSANGATCDANSVITLKSASISIGSVTFTNVTGTVTPVSITFQSAVADGEVQLTISGPYPETGAQYSATAQFEIANVPVVTTGSVDYSVANQMTVELGASTSGLNWSPLPGFSLSSGGVAGTFVRTGTGANEEDTFDLKLDYQGSWNPIGTVQTKAITAEISNSTGDLIASLKTSFTGGITVSDLQLDLSGLQVAGNVDFDSGRTELDVELGKLAIGKIAEIDESTVTLVYDPKDSNGGNSVFVSGSAAFEDNISSFFAGDSVETTIEFNDAGYLVSAEMDTAPSAPGFQLSELQFVYTSLIDPTVPFSYAPSYPEASGILIPLANEAPLVIAVSKSLPSSFEGALEDLKLNVIDPNSISVVAIELPPGEPKIAVYYGAPDQPYLIGSSTDSTYLRFDDVYLSIAAGAEDTFSIGGDVTLHTSNTDLLLESALDITVSETGAGIDGSIELIDNAGWNNAFGLGGLTVYDLLIQAGIDDGVPSFGVEATAAFPASVTSPLGVVQGSEITLGLDLSATTPCAIFDIKAPASNPGANVISLDAGSITATDAELIIAPEGCKLGEVSYSGYAMNFDGKIRGVGVGFATTFEVEPAFTLQGSGYIDAFPLGSVTMQETTASLAIDSAGYSLSLSGGLDAGTTVKATGTAYLSSNGGFTFDGEGQVFINGNGSDVTVHATDCKDSTCTQLTDPSFNLTGVIKVNGFEFDAAISADAQGDFSAKLTIPNQRHNFTFSNKSPEVKGSGTFTYTISTEVSNTKGGEIDFSGSVKLNSCTALIFDCRGSKVSWSDKVSTGSVEVSVTVDGKYKLSFKV